MASKTPRLHQLKSRLASAPDRVSTLKRPRNAGPWGHAEASSTARGYGAEWQRLRRVVLLRDCYLCQCDRCRAGELRVTVATHVDHIVPKAQGGTDDLENLRAVSAECHTRITLEQRGFRPKP